MPYSKAFNRFIGTDGYVVSGPLVEAVNCSIALERPLLVKGEPGTGKTLLATHIAQGLGLPMEQWHIKSTSKASEGLYVYDTLQRLNDARFGEGDVGDIRRYIKLGPLGRVFAAKERHVLLIDEVDKADLEFPNDILRELDEMRFTIMETRDEIVAAHRPVVIIQIRPQHRGGIVTQTTGLHLEPALARAREAHPIHIPAVVEVVKFYWLREQDEFRKNPSTSELVDWIAALLRSGCTKQQVESHIPFLGSLLKNEQDTDAVTSYLRNDGRLPDKWSDLGPKYNQ